MDVNLQIEFSNRLNLSEQIDLLQNTINFALIDPEQNQDLPDRFIYSKIRPKDEKILNLLNENLVKMENCLNGLNRKRLANMKGFTAPPAAVQAVGEAICILFAKTASYQNFSKMINSNDFMSQLKNFDLNLINDYKLKHLKDYIQMKNFNPSFIREISGGAALLCQWVICIYEYCQNLKLVIDKFSY